MLDFQQLIKYIVYLFARIKYLNVFRNTNYNNMKNLLFQQEDVKVTDLSNDIIGSNFSVTDGNTYFETSEKPHLDYESLKEELFRWQEFKDDEMRWEAKNQTENEF